MAGRGRGRGGKGLSFNIEVLGFGRGETLPTASLQPPPLYPPITFKAIPLATGDDYDYMLALKQEFRGASRKSQYFLNAIEKKKDIERYSDKYQMGQQESGSGWKPDFRRLPSELKIRPKKIRRPKGLKAKVVKIRVKKIPDIDVVKTLETLEKLPEEEENENENKEKEKTGKTGEEGDDDEEEEIVYEEEELEEETDYNLNYFDNGEGYGDDDDDVDEGPVY